MSNLPERPQAARARHLMDPQALPQRPTTYDDASVRRVQRWVMSALVVTVAMLLAAGWVLIAAMIVAKPAGQWVLLGNAAAFGVAGIAAALVIHQRRWLSSLLLLGFVPLVVGAIWIMR